MSKDLRVIKTRHGIQSRFIGLLADMDFHRITVKMIIDKCRINRSTFYRNYEDKYDLLNSITRRLMQDFKACIDTDFISFENKSITLTGENFDGMISFFESNKSTLQILTQQTLPTNISEQMKDIFSGRIADKITLVYKNCPDKKDIIHLFSDMIAGNILVCIRWWHFRSHNIDRKKLAEIICTTVNEGVGKSFYIQLSENRRRTLNL